MSAVMGWAPRGGGQGVLLARETTEAAFKLRKITSECDGQKEGKEKVVSRVETQ